MKLTDLPVLKMEFLATRRCELNCSYCKIVKDPNLFSSEMDTERVFKCIAMMAKYWPGAPIIFFGGEPTQRDDLPELIKRCVSLDVKHAVISNSLRVNKDSDYVDRLVKAGLSNWSISYDGESSDLTVDKSSLLKSGSGMDALRMFRDKHGIRDLVTCITVTKKNIKKLPEIIEQLTSEGVWSICTPLQIGGQGYEYSQGEVSDLPTAEQIDWIFPILSLMAVSGRYLMHNDAEWFNTWPEIFRAQNWKCHNKSMLTVDADGSLRYCVDIPLSEPIYLWDLEQPEKFNRYLELLPGPTPCMGCAWDPAYESISRAMDVSRGISKGRESFRHELSVDRISKLIPAARKYFYLH